jgi:hypothetical protein
MAIFWTQKQDIGPSARMSHALAYDALHDRVVVFGGDPGGAPLGDTWQWDGKLWTQVADTGPSARHSAAVGYEPQTQRIVLFGGASGPSVLGDTWAWNRAEWTQVADTRPIARAGHAMAYDDALTRIVLFGGAAGAGLMGDTWQWDGNEWTQVQDVGPTARRGHGMAYDANAQRAVLFGGAGSSGTGQNDTWAWDGSMWTQLADTGPDPRVGHALVADGGLVLFGGINSIDPALPAASRVVYGDTWRWVADGWTKVQDIGPAPRWGHGMAYRGQAGKAMLFGGSTVFAPAQDANLKPGLLLDTWELPLAISQEPGGGQPGGVPTSVQVASVTVQPNAVSAMGDAVGVGVTLTGPTPIDIQLVAYIFMDDGSGQFVPSQPQGFDLPGSIMVQTGGAGTQFQMTRNADPLMPGNYAVGVGVDTSNMQAGFFTVS